MPSKLNYSGTLILTLTLLISCSKSNTFPPAWTKSIPGRYEGLSSPYREVLIFREEGTYTHQAYERTNKLFEESGKWVASSNSFEIALKPDTYFFQFYDPMTRTFDIGGKKYGSYDYWPAWPLKEGTPFPCISASPNYEFCLKRQP
ncbi:MAG TPA: hypothetical protein VH413_10565 [Verrucomicrobiae bacterium]|jgi:hypothetical protein|nr:hypothetical protein [Verrucomicrobiae bacterium]